MQRVFASFSEEQYKRLLLILEDRENFPDSYSVWLETTENFKEHLARSRVAVYCVDVNADEFAAWCALKGHKVNRTSCAEFALHKFNELLAARPPHPREVNYAPIRDPYPDLVDSESEDN